MEILAKMDLAEGVKQKVAQSFEQMAADHREFIRQGFIEEGKVLMLMARPGDIDMNMVSPLIEAYSQLSKKSALNKAEHIIKIRKLIGSKKTLFLISEMDREFKKRMPKDRPQG